jgi:glutamyl-tRNA synthetase
VWGLAGATGGRVQLRIEDHDRQRSRPEHETALLDDLEWLGFRPDEPSIDALRSGASDFRQSDCGPVYEEALDRLRRAGLVYACACTRSTFAAWSAARGRPWHGPGCPGGCRRRDLLEDRGQVLRVALGDGSESFRDLLAGELAGEPSRDGDLPARDRHGNWTYGLAVVVDDARHGVDLVIRGRDLLHATGRQIRLGRLLGRAEPPAFLHHPLIHKPGGAKLSKADLDTGIHELRDAGASPAAVIGAAAAEVGLIDLPRPISAGAVASLFTG